MIKEAVFAGSFDPFTIGHYNLVERSSKIFDRLYVAVSGETGCKVRAELSVRLKIASESVKDLKNVTVVSFNGSLIEFCKAMNIACLVRGLRDSWDLDYEKKLETVYKSQIKEFECFYLLSDPLYSHVSASVVREILSLGGSVDNFVKREAKDYIKSFYN